MDPDDPTASYMLQAGARFCKCLGSEFLPYLPMVMPQLLQSASLSPDVTVREQDDDGEDIEEEDDDDDEVGTILADMSKHLTDPKLMLMCGFVR